MKYRDSFKFDTRDIDLIEQALRQQMNALTRSSIVATVADADSGSPDRYRELQNLLGKIHNQKIFYSQARPSSTPSG